MNKLKLIDSITDFHAASKAGISRGFSWYKGGMADTGDWYYKSLIKQPLSVLKVILIELKEEWKPKPPRIYTDEEKVKLNSWIQIGKNGFINKLQFDEQKKFHMQMEAKLLGL